MNVMFGLQGRDILEELKALPKRNVSVRAVSSIPSVATNSTDLEVLRENGNEVPVLITAFAYGFEVCLS